MALDSGEYDIAQFDFDEDTQDLTDRTHRRLHAVFVRTGVSRDDLYYVAASAVECLAHRRKDYMEDLAGGDMPSECDARARIGRVDAHFYFALARAWALEGRGSARERPQERDRQFERCAVA